MKEEDKGKISDGYHTFDELYEHRHALFIALCKVAPDDCGDYSGRGRLRAWRSKLHSDGTMYNDMFILGLDRDFKNQITYHLPIKYWDETNFAMDLEKAPKWDGHSSEDVLKRLKNI